MSVCNTDDEGAHADSAEGAVAGNNDRRRWVKLYDALHPRLDVADEVTVDEV